MGAAAAWRGCALRMVGWASMALLAAVLAGRMVQGETGWQGR
jgi:hypothetical protein